MGVDVLRLLRLLRLLRPERLRRTHAAPTPHLAQLRRVTILLWLIWAGFGLTYYGVILLITRIFMKDEDLDGDVDKDDAVDDEHPVACDFEYSDIFVSSTSEIMGLVLVLLVLDRIGRRKSQCGFYITCGIFTLAIGLAKDAPTWCMSTLAFVARAGAMAASCATWVVTPELYPTYIRGTGHRWGGASLRWTSRSHSHALTLALALALTLTSTLALALTTPSRSQTRSRTSSHPAHSQLRKLRRARRCFQFTFPRGFRPAHHGGGGCALCLQLRRGGRFLFATRDHRR